MEAATLSTEELKVMATDIAKGHGLNVDHFLSTISCESGWDIYAKGDYTLDGIHFFSKNDAPPQAEPTSFGLVQLHYPSVDWHIATDTAYKPATVLEMMAVAWGKGEQRRWSCWGRLYGL